MRSWLRSDKSVQEHTRPNTLTFYKRREILEFKMLKLSTLAVLVTFPGDPAALEPPSTLGQPYKELHSRCVSSDTAFPEGACHVTFEIPVPW